MAQTSQTIYLYAKTLGFPQEFIYCNIMSHEGLEPSTL
jgi:hypothetical protein